MVPGGDLRQERALTKLVEVTAGLIGGIDKGLLEVQIVFGERGELIGDLLLLLKLDLLGVDLPFQFGFVLGRGGPLIAKASITPRWHRRLFLPRSDPREPRWFVERVVVTGLMAAESQGDHGCDDHSADDDCSRR